MLKMTRKTLSSDLSIVIGLVLLADIFVLVPYLSGTFIRTILGLLLEMFLPGYALIAALFPEKSDLDGIERIALSFGLNIAVVPLIGLGLNYTQWGIRLFPLLFSLSVFTLAMCGLAYYRREKLPKEERFKVSFKVGAEALKVEILEKPKSKLDRVLTIILIFSIVASVITLIYVTLSPKEGEHFTEFYILGSKGIADNYPTHYTLGENKTVIVGVVNHEYRIVNYSMEVRLENVSLPLPEEFKHISIGNNATWQRPLTITPPFEGQEMKLEFLLFNDTEKNVSYSKLYLLIDVNSSESLKAGNELEV